MSAPTDSHLEIAHFLFIDIVAYSKLLIDQQTELPIGKVGSKAQHSTFNVKLRPWPRPWL